jgi:spoIIIJ-associated protein
MQEIIATGSTVDEAVDNACAQLGVSRDDVTYEVVDMPQKKLFGMSPARVLVRPTDDGFLAAKSAASPEKAPARAPERPAPKHSRVSASEPREYDTDLTSEAEEVEIPLADIPAPAGAALEYFKDIAARMGATKLDYTAYKTERGVKFAINGEDCAVVIGRRGETMEALQYLCMLAGSRVEGEYCKIMLDVAGYRSKREKTLKALAAREAAKVKKTRYSQTLEPMNPYERRIVHSAVQGIEGVKSESVGSEPYRRIVISLVSGGRDGRVNRGGPAHGGDGRREGRKPSGAGRGGSGGSGGRRDFKGRGDRGDRRQEDRPRTQPRPPHEPQQGPPREKPDAERQKSDADISKLYGKIDI